MITAHEALIRAIRLAESGSIGGQVTGPDPDAMRSYAAMARVYVEIHDRLRAIEWQETE